MDIADIVKGLVKELRDCQWENKRINRELREIRENLKKMEVEIEKQKKKKKDIYEALH